MIEEWFLKMWSLHLQIIRPHLRPTESEILEEKPAFGYQQALQVNLIFDNVRELLTQNKDEPQTHQDSVIYSWEALGKLLQLSKPEFTHQNNDNKTIS